MNEHGNIHLLNIHTTTFYSINDNYPWWGKYNLLPINEINDNSPEIVR